MGPPTRKEWSSRLLSRWRRWILPLRGWRLLATSPRTGILLGSHDLFKNEKSIASRHMEDLKELLALIDVPLLDAIERESRYVTGELITGEPVFLVVSSLGEGQGWSCRSIYTDLLRHDYPFPASADDVLRFLRSDLKGMRSTSDRVGSLERLSKMLCREDVLSRPHVLAGHPCSLRVSAAEAVLRHMELGR